MITTKINTVLGPLSADDLGVTLMHEHIVFSFPGWEGDQTVAPLNHKQIVDAAVAVMEELKAFKVKTFVDATTNDCGRNVQILRDVSEKSGVNIICSTGYYLEQDGSPQYWKFRKAMGYDITNELYELFMKEITEGIQGTGIKAGVIKIAASQGVMTDYEQCLHISAAKAQKDTGVPIITHTQGGTLGPEQAEFLANAGADPKRVAIGHMSDNIDIDYQIRTLKHAGYVAWDRTGVENFLGCPADVDKYAVIIEMVKRGLVDRILISHDTIVHWLGRPFEFQPPIKALIPNWHPTHLFKNVIKALKAGGVTDAQIKVIIEDNPRRLFTGQ
jgi:phosphotriesterase-related protein